PCPLAARGLGQAVDTGRRRRVRRVVRQAREGGGRRHIDDLAALGGAHHPQGGAQAEERLVEEARHHLAPLGVADALGGAACGRVRAVVHQGGEGGGLCHRRLHHWGGLGGARGIASPHGRRPAPPGGGGGPPPRGRVTA